MDSTKKESMNTTEYQLADIPDHATFKREGAYLQLEPWMEEPFRFDYPLSEWGDRKFEEKEIAYQEHLSRCAATRPVFGLEEPTFKQFKNLGNSAAIAAMDFAKAKKAYQSLLKERYEKRELRFELEMRVGETWRPYEKSWSWQEFPEDNKRIVAIPLPKEEGSEREEKNYWQDEIEAMEAHRDKFKKHSDEWMFYNGLRNHMQVLQQKYYITPKV